MESYHKRLCKQKNWFERLFGFNETELEYDEVKKKFQHSDTTLTSTANNASFVMGKFSTPSLTDLTQQVKANGVKANGVRAGRIRVRNVSGDVAALHAQPENRHAVFQAASQFNCLEFVGPNIKPEYGITGYFNDRTQGPACAIACAANTVYRNYFVPCPTTPSVTHHRAHAPSQPPPTLTHQFGQTAECQLNTLSGFSDMVGNVGGKFFKVQGGYTMASTAQLTSLNNVIRDKDRDSLRNCIRVGLVEDTQVTCARWGRDVLDDPKHQVTQLYLSACAVAYNNESEREDWEPLARLVLEAAYEATMCVAVLNSIRHPDEPGAKKVFLTALGGGVFGNSLTWIAQAIDRAVEIYREYDLDVQIVTYGSFIDHRLQSLERR